MRIQKQPDHTFGFPFIAYVPENCGQHPGLIIQLHGAGERGNGGKALEKVLVHGFSNVANDTNLRDCILVMPQCPTDSFWVAKIESLRIFIQRLVEFYHADENRISLCGLSMGGYGTWYAAMAYPDLFAAIAPCCGGGMAWNADVLKMPIRTFHGKEDDSVSVHQTIEMIQALEGVNPDFRYELYDGVGHASWKLAFSEELLRWLQAQHK